MADKSHIHRFTVTLSDVNRNVYAEFPVTAARHPSETEEYFAVRILVYILHWQEGIRFGRGVCAGEEPAVYVEETGRYKLWVEIGMPDFKRAVKASRLSEQVVVYGYRRESTQKTDSLQGISNLIVYHIESGTVALLTQLLASKRWSVTVMEDRIYLEADGRTVDFVLGCPATH